MAAGTYAAIRSQDRARTLRKIDWWLVASFLILLGMGLATLYSVGQAARYEGVFSRQIVRVGIGIVPFLVFLMIPPQAWRRSAMLLYGLNLLLLAAVLLVGNRGGGAQRWVQLGPVEFQPSEMSKLFLALTLASFFAARKEKIGRFSTFALSFLHVLVPAALVFAQPHLGATVVLIVIWLSTSIVAGVPARFVLAPVVMVAVVFVASFFVPGVLQPYQQDRMKSLVGRGDTYQASRAQLAFGAGGIFGRGYLKGEQKEGGHIPAQNTDFIFTVVGEEGGFVGASLVLFAFGFFFYRCWLVMYRTADSFAKFAAAGVLGALAFHTVVNLFMNVQMLPVVGLWLPFFSYGGTAMWLCLASVGLLLSVRRHERPLLF